MKSSWIVIALAALVVSAGPVLARGKVRHLPRCVDRPYEFSWYGLLDSPAPRPNGCAPPVFVGGEFIGQDPDPYIRQQLGRDPDTGYENPYQH